MSVDFKICSQCSLQLLLLCTYFSIIVHQLLSAIFLGVTLLFHP